MTVIDMPRVAECTASSCAYNHDGCHAAGVTIDSENGDCATFFPTSVGAGLPTVLATVGACQRTTCRFNDVGACSATEVFIGSGTDTAHCLTFSEG